jgi:hypothetical protein
MALVESIRQHTLESGNFRLFPLQMFVFMTLVGFHTRFGVVLKPQIFLFSSREYIDCRWYKFTKNSQVLFTKLYLFSGKSVAAIGSLPEISAYHGSSHHNRPMKWHPKAASCRFRSSRLSASVRASLLSALILSHEPLFQDGIMFSEIVIKALHSRFSAFSSHLCLLALLVTRRFVNNFYCVRR